MYIVMVKKLPRVCKTKTRDWGLLSLFRLLIYVLMSNFVGSSLVYSDLVYMQDNSYPGFSELSSFFFLFHELKT